MAEQTMQALMLAINGDYDSSIATCNTQLAVKQSFELLVIKAISLIAQNSYESAYKISNDALNLDNSRYEGYYYKGITEFSMGNIQSAQDYFVKAEEKTKSEDVLRNIASYQKKCELELSNQAFLNGPEKVEKMEQEKQQETAPVSQNIVSTKIPYTWYQTASKVGIELSYSLNGDRSLVTHKFTEKTFEVSFPLNDGEPYKMFLELFGDIVPEKCIVNVGVLRIEVVLEKQVEGTQWDKLFQGTVDIKLPVKTTTTAPAVQTNVTPSYIAPAPTPVPAPVFQSVPAPEGQRPEYPTSAPQKKNWDQIAKDVGGEDEDDSKPSGGNPMSALFKQMYDRADAKGKEALVQNWQASNGQTLSTVWNEGGKKNQRGFGDHDDD